MDCDGNCDVAYDTDENLLCDNECQSITKPCHGKCLFYMFLDCNGNCLNSIEAVDTWMCDGTCQDLSTPCQGKCYSESWRVGCEGKCEPRYERTLYKCHDSCIPMETPCNFTCDSERFLNCEGKCSTEGSSWLCEGKCQNLSKPCVSKCPSYLYVLQNNECVILEEFRYQLPYICKNLELPCFGICLNKTFLNCMGECVSDSSAPLKCTRRCPSWIPTCQGNPNFHK